MATALIDGISTRYEVVGSGPPLLMYAPGGFDATIEKWSSLGVYARVKLMDHLPRRHTCVLFDRRECGQSGGRVEAVTWADYVAQGRGLLDHLKIDRAFLMGGCMGCSPVFAFAVAHPERVLGMVLWWPVGGPKYRMKGRQRFSDHLAFVRENGLSAVVDLLAREGKAFGAEPRGGPWASVIRQDPAFAASYAKLDRDRYIATVERMRDALLDRDTAPGAEPQDLLRVEAPALIVPGHDESHATSAARYLEECLPRSEYWDVAVDAQTAENAPPRVLDFLASASARQPA
ncbi:MAG TPA: alpha/beta hydrolase [Usitatibacter sp.]|nr:alpha/beta hydrolase [Usitatibacter sp.]